MHSGPKRSKWVFNLRSKRNLKRKILLKLKVHKKYKDILSHYGHTIKTYSNGLVRIRISIDARIQTEADREAEMQMVVEKLKRRFKRTSFLIKKDKFSYESFILHWSREDR